jgi:hypothetical protein
MARRKSERASEPASARESLASALRSGRFPKEAKKTTPTLCPLEELIGQANRTVGWSSSCSVVTYLPSALFFFFFLFKIKIKLNIHK